MEKPLASTASDNNLCDDVCAVIVTYHPDIAVLHKLIQAITPQVGKTLIFDNYTQSPEYEIYLASLSKSAIEVLRAPSNLGLGEAINRASAYAHSAGLTYLLLLDQDSQPEQNMVKTLRTALHDLSTQHQVAAVGASFYDERSGEQAPFIRIGFPINTKLYGSAGESIQCDYLISSGSLIPLEVFSRIGGMDAGLFIDNVDMEWSFRARYHGYRLYGICDAKMSHRIGDRLMKLPFLRHRISLHSSPTRLYYIIRNRLLLYKRPETPLVWIAQDIPRLLLKLIGTSCFISPRRKNIKCMLAGLRDGLLGRSGSIDKTPDNAPRS